MSDVTYTQFKNTDLQFEKNKITVKDQQTGRDVDVPQLLFNYIDSTSPVVKMSADGKKRVKFVITGPKLRNTKPLVVRDGKNGSKDYSLPQSYDMSNPEHKAWVDVHRSISSQLADVLCEKDVKAFLKHDKLKSTIPSLVPCMIYQKQTETEDGTLVYEEGSRPSNFYNFFEAMTRDGKPFGTRVRILGSDRDLPREKWIKLLSENTVEYTPYVSYQRVSYVGGNFRLKTQLDTIIIHQTFKIERKTMSDIRQSNFGITPEDIARAKAIEAMLNSDSSETVTDKYEPAPEGSREEDW